MQVRKSGEGGKRTPASHQNSEKNVIFITTGKMWKAYLIRSITITITITITINILMVKNNKI